MAIETVRTYLKAFGLDTEIREFDVSSATVALAAEALGTEPARIAKSLTFETSEGNGCLMIVTAGDMKIDNSAFKARFGRKASMLSPDTVLALTGHAIGGVCPFGLPEGVQVYLDESLKRFKTVFPAAGSSNSAVELDIETLQKTSKALGYVNVCKPIVPLVD